MAFAVKLGCLGSKSGSKFYILAIRIVLNCIEIFAQNGCYVKGA